MDSQLEQWLEEWLAEDQEQAWTDKQVAIVRAAVHIFGEKGYASASTSEIAQRAGVAEGTIFKHFKTKKDLLLTIVAPIISKMLAPFVLRDFTKLLETPYPSLEEFLRAIVHNRMAFAQKHLPVIKIFLQEVPFHPELKERFLREVSAKMYERLEAAVTRYQRDGQIREMPPLTAIRLTATTVLGFLIARFIVAPEHAWNDEAEIEYTVQFLLRGLSPNPPRV